MKAFVYKSPPSEEEAIKALGPNAVILAGGTNLLNLMKEKVLEPDTVVNIKAIEGLDTIQIADGLRIGANVTLSALLEHEGIRKSYPAITQAIETLATPQIRNMATLGGNLCARPPCWYFMREGFPCPKRRSGDVCPAREGENEFHAIFGTDGPCVAVHASSLAPALIALNAQVRIVGPGGARELDIEKFFSSRDVTRENVLEPNEFITHVIIPRAGPNATYVVLHKASHDWPVGLASVALTVQGDTCTAARICLGAVAPIPLRAAAAEAALVGHKITEQAAEKAADAAVADARPLSQNRYKVKTTHAAVKRAILLAATGKWR